MALSYISYASAATTSVALPTFAAGDLGIVFAYRDGSNGAPALPAGWTNIASGGAVSCAARVGWRNLVGGDTTSGVWGNATETAVLVLRGHNTSTPIGPSANPGATTSNLVTYTNVTIDSDPVQSWIVGFAGHRTATDVYTRPASGMTNRSSTTGGATPSVACHTQADSFVFEDPNYRFLSVGYTVNATSGWRSYAFKINANIAFQTQTATAVVSLAPGGVPVTRTNHVLNIRARKTNAAHTGVMRVQLFENATPRSAVLSTPALTTSLADYALPIADADAATIGSYAELEARFNGYSSEGTPTVFEVDQVWLSTPAASPITLSVFPSVILFTIIEEWAAEETDIFPSPTLFPSDSPP